MTPKQTKKILELLDSLDGYGLILTDDDLLKERLKELKYEFFFGES